MIRTLLLVLCGFVLYACYESRHRVRADLERDLVQHEIRIRDQASGLWRRVVDGPERR